ncbi:MAG: hypothetical protein O3A08_05960 [Proteobacteria bacterium]|nr:hypothetical protein [Pseudomonadota bacterium]
MKHEFPETVELRTHSVQGGDTSNARAKAMLHGIRLSALCGNIWPANDDGLSKLVTEEIISELMAFSIHARRYMELTDNKVSLRSDGPLFKIAAERYKYEMNLWTAVNRVVHSSRIEIDFVTPYATKHDNLGDLLVAAALITSPQRDTVAVCPSDLFYGMCQSPLTSPTQK